GFTLTVTPLRDRWSQEMPLGVGRPSSAISGTPNQVVRLLLTAAKVGWIVSRTAGHEAAPFPVSRASRAPGHRDG
ncbi:MAG: hypothetical protein VX663_00005, partial [Pseudomonadota bacterium]|nr:hypothetical protein [Pseudomonadota bacterium]